MTKPAFKNMTPEEKRVYKREHERARVARKRAEKEEAEKAQLANPTVAKASRRAGSDFLRDAGVQNIHVIETVLDLADINRISAQSVNLESSWATELVEGEVIYRADMEALRQVSCPLRSEAEFRDFRYRCKTDHFFLGNEALERPNTFCEQPHRAWVEEIFFKKTPSLKPSYTQDDIAAWFSGITAGIPNRSLLMCSRNSRKSTAQIVDNVQFVINVPDIRLMQISAVKDLAKKFTKFFRFYWTIEDPNNRTLFAQLFPEFMIYADAKSDSNTFFCPMAHLGLGPTCVATSMDSSQTGARFDHGIFDDAADEENENTPTLRAQLVEKYDQICKLRAEYGTVLTIGTPQSSDQSESEGDLYAVIRSRAERNDYQYLRYRNDPAWKLKPEFEDTNVYEVTEDMIESLLFPAKLTFEFLKEELQTSSEKSFRRQYLLEWTDALKEEEKLQFDRAVLSSHIVDGSVLPKDQDAFCYGAGDFGFTLTAKRDPSAFSVVKYKEGVPRIYVLEQVQGRWRDSEKAEQIVNLTQKYDVKQWLFEAFPNKERLHEDIVKLAATRGVAIQIFWQPVTHVKHRKFYRLKSLEIPITRGRLKFVSNLAGTSSAWIETLFEQMEKLDGTKKDRRSSSIHDDLTEVLSMAVSQFPLNDDNEISEEAQKAKKAREEQAARDKQYAWIFRTPRINLSGTQDPIAPVDTSHYTSQLGQDSPLYATLRQAGLVREEEEGGSWGPSGAGFGYIRK